MQKKETAWKVKDMNHTGIIGMQNNNQEDYRNEKRKVGHIRLHNFTKVQFKRLLYNR